MIIPVNSSLLLQILLSYCKILLREVKSTLVKPTGLVPLQTFCPKRVIDACILPSSSQERIFLAQDPLFNNRHFIGSYCAHFEDIHHSRKIFERERCLSPLFCSQSCWKYSILILEGNTISWVTTSQTMVLKLILSPSSFFSETFGLGKNPLPC